jgi:hypothetical protein
MAAALDLGVSSGPAECRSAGTTGAVRALALGAGARGLSGVTHLSAGGRPEVLMRGLTGWRGESICSRSAVKNLYRKADATSMRKR